MFALKAGWSAKFEKFTSIYFCPYPSSYIMMTPLEMAMPGRSIWFFTAGYVPNTFRSQKDSISTPSQN
jgi:hypothetical protein